MLHMKKQGTVVKWDDARGFGFIRATGSSGDVFFHVRDFHAGGGGKPGRGLAVAFEEIHVGGKGPRAMAVQPAGEHAVPGRAVGSRGGRAARSSFGRAASTPSSGVLLALPLMVTYASAVVSSVWTRRLPWWVLPVLFIVNLLTFFAYWQDKYAASKGGWRISESTLHLWSMAGGWPGAWFAQQVLRHKSSKQSFRATYWATVVLHCAALGALLWWLPGWLAAGNG
jgi:uncharacterized membrane protein YsdA (DUF1294 family)/cold shock CspA family protein